MVDIYDKKVIIVEGLSDKKHIQKLIAEDIDIICTNGTFAIERFDEMLEKYDLDHREVYIFVDSDQSGVTLRRKLTVELPHAQQLYIPEEHVEVERTPESIVAMELSKHHIAIKPRWLNY